MTDLLPELLEAATGQPWAWSPSLWGLASADGRWLLADRDDGAWQLRRLPGEERVSGWFTPAPGEAWAALDARIATEVATLI